MDDELPAARSASEAVSRGVARTFLERCATDPVHHGDPLVHHDVVRVVVEDR